MGGHALKNTNCIRVNKELYDKIKALCISKLSKAYPNNDFITIIEIPEKETFGDLDLLYTNSTINIKDIVNELFSPNEIFINGNVLSFSYKINDDEFFQIDLIKVNDINMAQFYYGYGDTGNIIGRMLKHNNLTLGEQGLWINYENSKIILSNNPSEISNFLQLDYNNWKIGFNTKVEVFEWIIKCKFFDKNYFNPENFNNKYKIRFKIRPNFKEFVEYINNTGINNNDIKCTSIIDYIIFFNKQNEKVVIDNQLVIKKLHQEKFNGRIFLLYTEAKNINKYKEEFIKNISLHQDFNTYLTTNPIEFINDQIKDFIKHHVIIDV